MSRNEYRVVPSPAADRDLLAIYRSIAVDNPKAADRTLDGIDRRLKRLEIFPESCPLRPDIGENVRMLVADSYLALYQINGRTVDIMRVLHGARDLSSLLEN